MVSEMPLFDCKGSFSYIFIHYFYSSAALGDVVFQRLITSPGSVTDTCVKHRCSVWDEQAHEIIHINNLSLHQRPTGAQRGAMMMMIAKKRNKNNKDFIKLSSKQRLYSQLIINVAIKRDAKQKAKPFFY